MLFCAPTEDGAPKSAGHHEPAPADGAEKFGPDDWGSSVATSLQSAATLALRLSLNMSPIISMPFSIPCPMPPSSGWLNWALRPPDWLWADAISLTAAVETPWRSAMLEAV